jgi:methionyl-tRNA synthetase
LGVWLTGNCHHVPFGKNVLPGPALSYGRESLPRRLRMRRPTRVAVERVEHNGSLAARYGADAVRWWLLREVPRVGDADFTVERMIARADGELANGLGNLVNRVIAMIHRYRGGLVPVRAPGPLPVPAGGEDLAAACREARGLIGAALEQFDFRRATAAVWAIADEANRSINRVRPWELARAERGGGGQPLDTVLAVLFEACSALGRELAPFLPDAAALITRQCTPRDGRLPQASPVFRRLSR